MNTATKANRPALLSLAAPLRLPAGAYPSAIIASDLNGDQRADLAVVNADDNTVSVGMPHLRHPETMKTGFGAVILGGDASPDQVGIYLVP